MKKLIVSLLIAILLSSCSPKKDKDGLVLTRSPIESFTYNNSENIKVFSIANIDQSESIIINEDTLISRNVSATLNTRSGDQLNNPNRRTIEDITQFDIQIENLSSRIVQKKIDLLPHLEQLEGIVLASSSFSYFSKNGEGYLRFIAYTTGPLLMSYNAFTNKYAYAYNSTPNDYSLYYSLSLDFNLETETFDIPDVIDYNQLEYNSHKLDNFFLKYDDQAKTDTFFENIRYEIDDTTLRLVIKASQLPQNNHKLYSVAPHLQELRNRALKDIDEKRDVEDSCTHSGAVIYLYGIHTFEDVFEYFQED